MKIELSEQQVQALFGFLQRVQMNGQEAVAFVDVMQALSKGVEAAQNGQETPKKAVKDARIPTE